MKRMPWSIRKVLFAYACAVVTLLGVGTVTYRVLFLSTESERLVRHTYEVVELLQDVVFASERVKSSYRGYVLTGQDSHVDAYRASRQAGEQYRGAIRLLTADNPEQQARLPALEALAVRQATLAEGIIAARRTSGINGAIELARASEGQRISDELQAVVRDMLEEERGLLGVRMGESARRLRETEVLLLLGTLLGLAITAGAGWRVRREALARDAMEAALFVEKERAQVTLDSIGDAVICTDASGKVSFLNAVAEGMTGWAQREAAGRSMAEVFNAVDATTRVAIPDPMQEAIAQDRAMQLPPNCVLIHRDGRETPVEDSVAPIHDREGLATGAVIVFRDVSESRAAALALTHSAQHDFLTGLPNRLLLSDRLSQAIALARRHMKQVAILYLDLDGFKAVNDSLGHPAGDKLLQSVAARLSECVRGADTVSRQGGDEFVVLLSEIEHPEDAAITARRMLQAVARPHRIEYGEVLVTTSIGVSVYPDDGADAEALIKNADTAMYQAKEGGRRGYRFFKASMDERAVERQFLEEGLRLALERAEMEVLYQPTVDVASGTIVGAQALLRWNHPERGPISPAQFVPVAEDCGFTVAIGAWMLGEACAQARAWRDAGLPQVTMAANVSAMQFRDDGFLSTVAAVLAQTRLDPRFLELELTEKVLLKGGEASSSVLRALRDQGVRVALDDFGMGHSSLDHLRRFPVDALKIDESFVRLVHGDPADPTLVAALISMARSLGLRVVAEGVETPEELAFLQSQRCDAAQGFLFGRPLPPSQFAWLLAAGLPHMARGVRREPPSRTHASGAP